MRSDDKLQYVLIGLGVVATALLGAFFYREAFPEYLIYQKDYVALEKFRASYTPGGVAPFQEGVKQIVIEREDKGPPLIDRCVSCHVALRIEAFSPMRIQKDINGNNVLDPFGVPVKEPNPDYVWTKLDQTIADLEAKGGTDNIKLANSYKALKTAKVGEDTYDVTKVLRMHPLMGRETRAFEYHSVEEYGCTTCHGGNGRGLVTDRAHGPVLDGKYEVEDRGFVPQFLEVDPANDPPFAHMFNAKPGHRLLFQTTPIYIGPLVQAKCVQCHLPTKDALTSATDSASVVLKQREKESQSVEKALDLEKQTLAALLNLQASLKAQGYEKTVAEWEKHSADYALPTDVYESYLSQLKFLKQAKPADVLAKIQTQLLGILGTQSIVDVFEKNFKTADPAASVDQAITLTQALKPKDGTLFERLDALNFTKELMKHVRDVSNSFNQAVGDEEAIGKIQTDVDLLTNTYQRGQELFLSQACFACHRVTGFSRGGVGPELSRSGDGYPWFVKESIVWPQADLKTSQMPNMRLDHEELEALVTYLLGQTSKKKTLSETANKIAVQEWEAGKKLSFEKPATPAQIQDINYGMTVFAVEGCASCHRLRGYESNVGFAIEKGKPSFEELQKEKKWFESIFPETINGSQIIAAIEKHREEIDKKIAGDVRQDAILEKIEAAHPDAVEALYSNFKFALRAKNAEGEKVSTPWKESVRKVLKMFVQEYGLGRVICPRPSWSGVMRSDQWLMEHFRNPASHVPRSMMPVFPFDDTKYYALTNTLDRLAQKNVQADRTVWTHEGFKPEVAFEMYCSQCHGEQLQGNGPVAEWIYPIPKNLRRADFLRNLTRERAIESITHGVKGTPMPPWGELGADKPFPNKTSVFNAEEIRQLVDWIFSSLPGGAVITNDREVPKWNYSPEDVLQELKEEGHQLKGDSSLQRNGSQAVQNPAQKPDQPTPSEPATKKNDAPAPAPSAFLELKNLYAWPTGAGYYAAASNAVLRPLPKKEPSDVADVFDIVLNSGRAALPDPEKYSYYIKEQYYTPDNIAAGERFFIENCAACHGKEADGTGQRAEAMSDAKPRMLNNLDWISTRDDLRLLRSIKYGVLGTAMTPWGDFTNSLQRLQLVIFIRSLSQDKKERRSLTDALYLTYDDSEFLIERARLSEFAKLETAETAYKKAAQKQQSLDNDFKEGSAKDSEALAAYQKELELSDIVTKQKQVDEILQNLRQGLKKEKDALFSLGAGFLNMSADEKIMKPYIAWIENNQNTFSLKDNILAWNQNAGYEAKAAGLQGEILQAIDQEIALLKQHAAPAEMAQINAKVAAWEKKKNEVIATFAEVVRTRKANAALMQQYQKIQAENMNASLPAPTPTK